jgi:hypothetical protein
LISEAEAILAGRESGISVDLTRLP